MSSFRASASITSFRGSASLSSRAQNSTAMSFMPSFGRRRSKDSDEDSGSVNSQEALRGKGRALARQEIVLLQQQHDLSEQLLEQQAQIEKLQELHERLAGMVTEQETQNRRDVAMATPSSGSDETGDIQGYVDDEGYEVTVL
mmetsp:Transcript_6229/g.14896  ORF Transcript_6229/g.14896 Transcript_6229/m.14896 type:complete len:143 (+) Transcript_6229:116-544(+)